jgi:hypothetical protein
MSIILALRRHKQQDHKFKASLVYIASKKKKLSGDRGMRFILGIFWRAGGMAQVIECLPSKRKALSSNPRTATKKTF